MDREQTEGRISEMPGEQQRVKEGEKDGLGVK